MYEKYWNLNKLPFENTPDPAFFFESEQHAEAFSRMTYVVREKKACGVLTGVYGCGKTLILHALQKELEPEGYRFSVVNNPRLDDLDILRMSLHGFNGSEVPRQKADVLIGIEKIVKETADDGKHAVVIIDEAHSIDQPAVFEELRLLTNFQTDVRSLVTLLLVGQPDLKGKIDSNKQLNQRVSISYHLKAFAAAETGDYIAHRLKKAGASGQILSGEAVSLIHQRSGGIPRWINNICHLCLLTAFTKNVRLIDPDLVTESIQSLGAGV